MIMNFKIFNKKTKKPEKKEDPILQRVREDGLFGKPLPKAGSMPVVAIPQPDRTGTPALNPLELDSIVKGVVKELRETEEKAATKAQADALAKRNLILKKVTDIRTKLNDMKDKSFLSRISSFLDGKSDVAALKDILYAIETGEQQAHIVRDLDLMRSNPILMGYLKEIADLGDPIAQALVDIKWY